MKYLAAFSFWAVSLASGVIAYTPVSGIYPLNASKSAIATTYGGNWPGGMCSFSDYPHVGLNGVALGGEQWFGAAGCGACIKITGASGSVTAMVNDQCPECKNNHLDLDEAYAAKVDANFRTKGIFDIKWEFVPCPISGNLQFKNKEGTSQWYFAMQVRNSRLPIDTFEVSTNNGATWTKVNREPYNFFTYYSGFGTTVDVRITSTTGQQIIQKGIKVSSGSIVQGTQQFSA
ncbi:Expansin-yoaJ AltName: Full=EXLX1 [Rhizoctonia solani AG-1 IB]|nr:Expansin-yoaJ AltName: Full=EXLX1 [Rhizoctonia solani AG-1 IB]